MYNFTFCDVNKIFSLLYLVLNGYLVTVNGRYETIYTELSGKVLIAG